MKTSIRLYQPRDAPLLAELFYRSVTVLGPRDYSSAQVEVWASRAPAPDAVHARCADGRTVLVAVDDEDQILAYGDLEVNGHIDHLYCAPEAAGKGVASALYDQLEAEARLQGLNRLFTEASEAARRLFEHKGFIVLYKRAFEINGVTIHNYVMEKHMADL